MLAVCRSISERLLVVADAVMSGTHYNDGCCFDYGNSEVNDRYVRNTS